MKQTLDEYIKSLTEILEEYGNLNVIYAVDDEGLEGYLLKDRLANA